jgi:hypothetical protein
LGFPRRYGRRGKLHSPPVPPFDYRRVALPAMAWPPQCWQRCLFTDQFKYFSYGSLTAGPSASAQVGSLPDGQQGNSHQQRIVPSRSHDCITRQVACMFSHQLGTAQPCILMITFQGCYGQITERTEACARSRALGYASGSVVNPAVTEASLEPTPIDAGDTMRKWTIELNVEQMLRPGACALSQAETRAGNKDGRSGLLQKTGSRTLYLARLRRSACRPVLHRRAHARFAATSQRHSLDRSI